MLKNIVLIIIFCEKEQHLFEIFCNINVLIFFLLQFNAYFLNKSINYFKKQNNHWPYICIYIYIFFYKTGHLSVFRHNIIL